MIATLTEAADYAQTRERKETEFRDLIQAGMKRII